MKSSELYLCLPDSSAASSLGSVLKNHCRSLLSFPFVCTYIVFCCFPGLQNVCAANISNCSVLCILVKELKDDFGFPLSAFKGQVLVLGLLIFIQIRNYFGKHCFDPLTIFSSLVSSHFYLYLSAF